MNWVRKQLTWYESEAGTIDRKPQGWYYTSGDDDVLGPFATPAEAQYEAEKWATLPALRSLQKEEA